MEKEMMLKTRADKAREEKAEKEVRLAKRIFLVFLIFFVIPVVLIDLGVPFKDIPFRKFESKAKDDGYYLSTPLHLNAEYNEYAEQPCLRHYGVRRAALDRDVADSHRRAVIGSVRHLAEADRMKEYRRVLEQCKSLR